MGGSESSHLAIQLESNLIQAGNGLSGVIHFHLLSPIHAESLCLKLSGKEKVKFASGEDTYRGKSTVVKENFQVFIFQNAQVNPGDYSFPFQMITPSTLPGSFAYQRRAMKASLRYHLTAFLHSTGSKVR